MELNRYDEVHEVRIIRDDWHGLWLVRVYAVSGMVLANREFKIKDEVIEYIKSLLKVIE